MKWTSVYRWNLLTRYQKRSLPLRESGISNAETIVTLRQAGFKGFLIGETFMKEADPGKAFADFVAGLKAYG
ncbi:MAG: hypothetical protein WDO71_26185 [Bacteroidota bacterium]